MLITFTLNGSPVSRDLDPARRLVCARTFALPAPKKAAEKENAAPVRS